MLHAWALYYPDTLAVNGFQKRKKTKKIATYFLKKSLGSETVTTRMWANAQRDGHPAEYRWRPLFNAAKLG